MRLLYQLISNLESTSDATTISQIDKKFTTLYQETADSIGYNFLILKNAIKVFPFYYKDNSYHLREPFEDEDSKLYHFLKANGIHSILFKKGVDIKDLVQFFLNESTRPANVLTNVYSEDFDLGERIFESLLTILLYPNRELKIIIKTLSDFYNSKDEELRKAIQKVHGDWIGSYNKLKTSLDSIFKKYSKLTFIIRYPLGKSRNKETEPEGFHIFFENAEFDIDYAEHRRSEFFRKPLYIQKDEKKERLDSLCLKQGVEMSNLFSFFCKVRGQDKLLFKIKDNYKSELDLKKLPQNLYKKIAKSGNISAEAKVDILENGEKWAIRESGKKPQYIIIHNEQSLEVYEKIGDIKNISINPIKVGVIDVEDEFSELIATTKKNEKLKDLVMKLKHHNNHLQGIIRKFKQKFDELQKELNEAKEKKVGFEQIKQLENELEKIRKERDEAELSKKQILEDIKQVDGNDVNIDFINKISQELQLAPEDTIKLISPDIIEDIVREKMKTGGDETAALVIESGRVGGVIEKGLRDGQFSAKEVQNFVMDTVNPMGKKEVARDLARQLSKATPLPLVPEYEFTSFSDFSPYPGGDACFVYPIDFARVAIGMFDMEGTGLEQSCNLFSVKVLFERLLSNKNDCSPETIIYNLQKEMSVIRQSEPGFHSFSALIGILNCIEHTFIYSRAAMPYLYLYNRNTSVGNFLEHSGIPRIGVLTDNDYYNKPFFRVKLCPSDVLFIQTNGFLDGVGGEKSFESMIQYLPENKMEEFFSEKFRQARQGRPLEDDVYLFSLEHTHDKNSRETDN